MLHPTERQRVTFGAIVGVLIGCGIGIFVWGLVSNHARIMEIQRSRILSAESSCQQQNERHERLFAQIEETAQRQRVKEPEKYRETIAKALEVEALLNAVQPAENCQERARMLVEETLHHKRPAKQKPVRAPGPLRLAP